MQLDIFRWCSFTSTNNLLPVHFVKFAIDWLVVYFHSLVSYCNNAQYADCIILWSMYFCSVIMLYELTKLRPVFYQLQHHTLWFCIDFFIDLHHVLIVRHTI